MRRTAEFSPEEREDKRQQNDFLKRTGCGKKVIKRTPINK